MQFYGFFPRLLLGVLFGYLLVWSGSMWLPIIAHFINNAVAVIGLFLMDKGMIGHDIEEIGTTDDNQYMAFISIIITALLLWLIKQQFMKSELQKGEPE
jgi:hypothetical protein